MTEDQREIRRKKRVIEHAAKNGNIKTTCRRFGGSIAREREVEIHRIGELVHRIAGRGGDLDRVARDAEMTELEWELPLY